MRNPASRFAFVRQDGGVLLFVDGETFECTGEAATLAEQLCVVDAFAVGPTSSAVMELLLALANKGSIAFAGDED